MEDRCVCCGNIIPEGTMVCRECESGVKSIKEENEELKCYISDLKRKLEEREKELMKYK